MNELSSLEQLAGRDTWVHRLHPAVKLLSALAVLLTVMSFGRYEIARIIPFVFYPAVLMAASETHYGLLNKRAALALPFCLIAGVSNIIFDRDIALMLGNIPVSFGTLSFVSILLKTYLCVMAALILVATTPMRQLTSAMRTLRVPRIFITVFEMTYRYLGTLIEEAGALRTAYLLRSAQQKGVEARHMGSFIGSLLIRSFDRAERVYDAMKCRGYALQHAYAQKQGLDRRDMIFLLLIVLGCALLRFFDPVSRMNELIGGLLH